MELKDVKCLEDLFKVKDIKVEFNNTQFKSAEDLKSKYKNSYFHNDHIFIIETSYDEMTVALTQQPNTCGLVFINGFDGSFGFTEKILEPFLRCAIEICKNANYTKIKVSHVNGLIFDVLEKVGFTKVDEYVNKRSKNVIQDYVMTV